MRIQISTIAYVDFTLRTFLMDLTIFKMRRGLVELVLIIAAVIGIHAERFLHNGTIVGKITPGRSTSSVIAVKGKDSIKTISHEGHFGMQLQPGDWKLIFAEYNYPTTERKIQVQEGQHINLGEIKLSQE